MAWLKTKKIKKCICGRQPKSSVEFDDQMQARAWLMLFIGSLLPVMVVAGLIGGFDSAFLNDIKTQLVFAGLAIFWLFFGYFLAKYKKKGHSLKCAVRQAFLRVI